MTAPVAYLVNQYPKVSHSFVRREIHALERAGTPVLRFAVRGWDSAVVDTEDARELQLTRYLLRGGLVPLVRAFAVCAARSPISMMRALRLAFTLGHRADRPRWIHLVYLFEASLLSEWLRGTGAVHLHAHFGTNATTVAMLCRALGGPSFSFTVHGPEEFDRPEALKLRDKVAAAAFVVAISEFGRSQLMRWARLQDWPKLKVVHCGLEPGYGNVHPPKPDPCQRGIAPDTSHLVCVGRLVEQKGQLLLIEAVARLRQEGVQIKVVLAGDGEMRAAVEQAVLRHGLSGCVRITGWLSSDQVREEIRSARALVLPSFAEGLPVVLMEAMALGKPVVSTWVAGIPELVRHQEDGWLVPAGSIAALADAIAACLSAAPTMITDMGIRARLRVAERHNVDASARRLQRHFALAGGSAP